MHYVKHFDINGVDTKQVACIELHGKPNAATEGAVGVLGIDMDSPIHDVYKCVAVNGSIYTWELLSSGLSIMSATISGEGSASVDFPYTNLLTPAMYVVKVGDLILDSAGYLYQIKSLNSTYCTATYCGTQVVAYGKSAYDLAVKHGFEGDEVEWIASLKGEKGDQGIQGRPGATPYIGGNGNWWIAGVDTGVFGENVVAMDKGSYKGSGYPYWGMAFPFLPKVIVIVRDTTSDDIEATGVAIILVEEKLIYTDYQYVDANDNSNTYYIKRTYPNSVIIEGTLDDGTIFLGQLGDYDLELNDSGDYYYFAIGEVENKISTEPSTGNYVVDIGKLPNADYDSVHGVYRVTKAYSVYLGFMDLRQYREVKVTYGGDGGIADYMVANGNYLGLSSNSEGFGIYRDDNYDYAIAKELVQPAGGGGSWYERRTSVTIDLSDVEYVGNVYFSCPGIGGLGMFVLYGLEFIAKEEE